MSIWYFLLIFSFVMGTVMGSFANVLIYRLPRAESVMLPGSHCPVCNSPIRWFDNIPVLSYLMLRGQCRTCGEPISWRYPAVEFVTGLLFLGVFMRMGLTWSLPGGILLAFALVVVTFIDLDHKIIPNVITFPGMVIGVVLSFLPGFPGPRDSIIGLLAGGGFLWFVGWSYLLVTKREGMGMGDVKLLGLIGAFLGWQALPVTILAAALTGSVIGMIAMKLQGEDSTYAVPFGPFLALGALAHLFVGRELILWYLGRMY